MRGSPSLRTATNWIKQIERVFLTEMGEAIKRTSSARDLMNQLGQAKPRLLCSLVHKFGRKDVDDFDAFIRDLEAKPSPDRRRGVRVRGRMSPAHKAVNCTA